MQIFAYNSCALTIGFLGESTDYYVEISSHAQIWPEGSEIAHLSTTRTLKNCETSSWSWKFVMTLSTCQVGAGLQISTTELQFDMNPSGLVRTITIDHMLGLGITLCSGLSWWWIGEYKLANSCLLNSIDNFFQKTCIRRINYKYTVVRWWDPTDPVCSVTVIDFIWVSWCHMKSNSPPG